MEHTDSLDTDLPGLSLPANKVSSLLRYRLPTSDGGALLRPPGLHTVDVKFFFFSVCIFAKAGANVLPAFLVLLGIDRYSPKIHDGAGSMVCSGIGYQDVEHLAVTRF